MAAEAHRELAAQLPLTGRPSLEVDLTVLPAASVLSAIHEAKRSGLVLYRHRQLEKQIYVDGGEVVFASSNQSVDRLGECLLRSGALSLAELREAENAFQPGDRFGRVLVDRGMLTPRELWNGVRSQVEEIVRSLFAVPSGRLWFWEGDIRPDNVVRLSLETSRLIAEGQQRSLELRRFLTVLDDPRVQLSQTSAPKPASLAGNEREIYDAIAAGSEFAAVVAKLGIDRESAARSIQLLRLVGAVKLMRLPDAAAKPAQDSALTARAEAFAKLIASMTAALARADGDRSVDERLARELRDVAARFPALLAGFELGGDGCELDARDLAERASHVPEAGEDVLAAALGELVTYLEFELVNHPQISDPNEVLASLGVLRRAAFA